ncbi:MAG: nucleotide exchange factor GrpE [Deltaproteobacteria bacterium]|nr:nucleotide exchange factor GrpE [Deltaproteobacteria bacterium]
MKKEKTTPQIDIDPEILQEAAAAIPSEEVAPSTDASIDAASISTTEPEDGTADKETQPDYKDRFIRLSADFDNYRKRILKEKTDYIKYGNEALLKEILPILDNFERALSASSESDATSILQGVEMIFGQLTQSLEKFGLHSEVTQGQPFDPNLHEAMSNVEDDSVAPNTVIQEHQKLYRYHEKLLRPALVTVSKAKDDSSAS